MSTCPYWHNSITIHTPFPGGWRVPKYEFLRPLESEREGEKNERAQCSCQGRTNMNRTSGACISGHLVNKSDSLQSSICDMHDLQHHAILCPTHSNLTAATCTNSEHFDISRGKFRKFQCSCWHPHGLALRTSVQRVFQMFQAPTRDTHAATHTTFYIKVPFILQSSVQSVSKHQCFFKKCTISQTAIVCIKPAHLNNVATT